MYFGFNFNQAQMPKKSFPVNDLLVLGSDEWLAFPSLLIEQTYRKEFRAILF